MSVLSVPAPAKLNLFLHVVGRRDDGYHELESLMVLLDFGDTLELQARGDGEIRRLNALPDLAPEADLCVRAAKLLQQEAGSKHGVDIALNKRIPMSSGLGGGSSDAASTLLALNRLWGVNWPRQALIELVLRLGADVPFFVFGQSALARGIGEQLSEVTLPRSSMIVAVPPVAVPTSSIFSDAELRRTPRVAVNAFALDFGHNDLEAVARARHPEVGACLDALARVAAEMRNGYRASLARMSGSGASSFLILPQAMQDPTAILSNVQALAPRGTTIFAARSLARHPLYDYA